MRDLGRLLQKMKLVAVEQRFVPCQVPLSPLIYFLTVLLALWAFIPFAVLLETGNKCGELITKSGFVLRGKKPQQARHNRGWCCAGLAMGCLYSLQGTSNQNSWKCSVSQS